MLWLSAAIVASGLLPWTSAIRITDFQSCPIPYMIPRAFETKCDPADAFIDDLMLPVKLPAGFQHTKHPQYITGNFIRTKPNIWTHEPYCLESVDGNTGVCTYTDANFGNGRGISIVASPKEYDRMVQAPVLQSRGADLEPHVNPANETRMEMMPIPKKGLGMRSKEILLRGQTAQSYTPVLSVQDLVMQLLPVNDYAPLLRQAVERLHPDSQKLFNDLWGHWGGNADYDKINTNAFTAFLGKSEKYFWSVYPETSVSFNVEHIDIGCLPLQRYNHDCRPNTMYSIESDSFVHNLRVSRSIIPGEEVTLSCKFPAKITMQFTNRCLGPCSKSTILGA
jgi:hypothetical protein